MAGPALRSFMLFALLVALAIAALAYAAGALTISGASAAVVVGALCVLAGRGWAALLIFYFIVAVAFSKLGAEAKARRTGGVVAKAGRRDAVQVLANGGGFALAAFLANRPGTTHASFIAAAAVGALAASAADTLATEIGTFVGGEPRSVTTWRVVPTGTSGGVSTAGSLAMLGGAILIPFAAFLMGLTTHAVAAAFGGLAGATADSLLGALVQERRRCPHCGAATERRVHDCGTATDPAGGLSWLDNDLVNLCATIVGAVVAAAVAVA